MKIRRCIARDQAGVAAIEMAFALPILIVMIWAFVQFAEVYRAVAGIQQGLGEGARYATLCVNPSITGCQTPAPDQVRNKILSSVYGIGPGTFTVPTPVLSNNGTSNYYDLSVTYTQPTSLLIFPGPTMTVSKSKRVWVAA